jgi:hypothetical protein
MPGAPIMLFDPSKEGAGAGKETSSADNDF